MLDRTLKAFSTNLTSLKFNLPFCLSATFLIVSIRPLASGLISGISNPIPGDDSNRYLKNFGTQKLDLFQTLLFRLRKLRFKLCSILAVAVK